MLGGASSMATDDELVPYLDLAPEFGGTRFGPFEQLEVRLGSNGERCHIVLPESLGVLGEHVRLIRQGPKNLILAPAERTATVFLYKQDSRRPTQLNTPTAVRPGDAFALVTPDGPKFIIRLDVLPPEVQQQREAAKRKAGTGRGRLNASSMANEGKRQIWTRILVFGPMQILQRAVTFVRSGAIYQPRNVFMGMILLGGWLLGGFAACSNRSKSRALATTVTKYEDCQSDRDLAMRLGDDVEGAKIEELSAKITGSLTLGSALEQDQKLRAKFKERAKVVLDRRGDFSWLVKPQDRQAQVFATWRERMADTSEFDRDTATMLTFIAANPKLGRGDWDMRVDSESTDVCARGPARLTFRQAMHLGISAQPDAYYRGQQASMDAPADREALLKQTVEMAGYTLPEGTFESVLDPIRAGEDMCITIAGDDDRERERRIIKQLTEHLGPDAKFVPPTDTTFASVARVAKFWAADLLVGDYEDAKEPQPVFKSDTTVSATLDGIEGRGDWVLTRTADTIARAVVLPCVAVLQGDRAEVEKILGEDLPSPVTCLVLDWKMRNE